MALVTRPKCTGCDTFGTIVASYNHRSGVRIPSKTINISKCYLEKARVKKKPGLTHRQKKFPSKLLDNLGNLAFRQKPAVELNLGDEFPGDTMTSRIE